MIEALLYGLGDATSLRLASIYDAIIFSGSQHIVMYI
jgi:hypothetical protein